MPRAGLNLLPRPARSALNQEVRQGSCEWLCHSWDAGSESSLVARSKKERHPAWVSFFFGAALLLRKSGRLRAVIDCFKRTVRKVGLPNLRIHDLRHTYAVNSIRAGDDIKTVQSNLGHATAAFTLDVYGHFTDDMRQASSQRMEQFISGVLGL